MCIRDSHCVFQYILRISLPLAFGSHVVQFMDVRCEHVVESITKTRLGNAFCDVIETLAHASTFGDLPPERAGNCLCCLCTHCILKFLARCAPAYNAYDFMKMRFSEARCTRCGLYPAVVCSRFLRPLESRRAVSQPRPRIAVTLHPALNHRVASTTSVSTGIYQALDWISPG